MKLRHLLVISFTFIVIIPMGLFWAWPYSEALDYEIKDVHERHLVIAKNLSGTFEAYYNEIIDIFSIIELQSEKQLNSQAFQSLLNRLQFDFIAKIDNEGKQQKCLFYNVTNCPETFSQEIMSLVESTLNENKVTVSTVTVDERINNAPILLVIKKVNDDILIGYLSTRYIVERGKKVSFGKKGHAAIVDQAGNVLAHPLDSWISQRKDMSKISPVIKMLEGKTGVDRFYSPALKGDMIAGYTYVPNANWGVMVPQPIKELEDKVIAIEETAILVMFLGLGLALLIALPASLVLCKPLEDLSRIIKLIEKGGDKTYLQQKVSKFIPLEIRELKKSFFAMMKTIDKKENAISKLAYFDSITELPNRDYFYKLSNLALKEMKNNGQHGALIFIDFDGFKAVNDNYGHQIGDELLYIFSQRIIQHFYAIDTHTKTLSFYDALPNIIPARLGGDEFVILIQNIKNKNELELMIQKLLMNIFAKYHLGGQTEFILTGSTGVALFPENGQTSDDLIKMADIAMYDAKSKGKNQIQFSK